MRRNTLYAMAIIMTAIVAWFIAASLLFVWIGGLQGQLDYPWLACWMYWGDPDPNTRLLLTVSGLIPVMAAVAIGVVAYRIAADLRNRRRFPFWPWQWRQEEDSPRPLERGVTDNHGHSIMMTDNELRREFPPIR